MKKSDFYISCTGKLCITVKNNQGVKPELFIITGVKDYGTFTTKEIK